MDQTSNTTPSQLPEHEPMSAIISRTTGLADLLWYLLFLATAVFMIAATQTGSMMFGPSLTSAIVVIPLVPLLLLQSFIPSVIWITLGIPAAIFLFWFWCLQRVARWFTNTYPASTPRKRRGIRVLRIIFVAILVVVVAIGWTYDAAIPAAVFTNSSAV